MISTLDEDLIPLTSAWTYLNSRGIQVTRETVYRWASPVGVNGVRLETIKVAKRTYTSRQAIQRFVEETTKAQS